jgi:hypothetical protein
VCRHGGKIGLANWTPDGFVGQLFKTIGKHVPPPPGARSPALWGTRARLARLSQLREGIADFSVKMTGKSESIQGVKNSKRL